MAVIVEIRRRGGQLIERCRLVGGSLRIGRAYDNDIVVDDPYVSAHHLRLDPCEEGWQVNDLDSLNGYRIKSHRRTVKRTVLHSGEEVQIGQLVLRVFHSHHPVPEPVKVNSFERYLNLLGWHRVWPFVMALAVAVVALDLWSRIVVEMRLDMVRQPALDLFKMVAAIALVWAFTGRIFRHQARFFSHLSVWGLFFVLLYFSDQFAAWVGYNFSDKTVAVVVSRAMQLGLLVLAIWSSLALAANFHSRGRILAAVCASALFVSWQVLESWQPEIPFSSYAKYHGGIRAPAMTWVAPQPESAVDDVLADLLDKAQQDAGKEIQ